MHHRLFAVLVIVCFALGGASCASESQIESREEIVMPRQTGSTLQRRVMVKSQGAAKKSKKKKDKKEKKEAKPTTPKPTPKPTPAPEVTEEATEEPTPAPPDRFR
jgi:outer membrane biosynthesis protein TonB